MQTYTYVLLNRLTICFRHHILPQQFLPYKPNLIIKPYNTVS